MDLKTLFILTHEIIQARNWVGNEVKSKLLYDKLNEIVNHTEMQNIEVNLNNVLVKVGSNYFNVVAPFLDRSSAAYKLLHSELFSPITVNSEGVLVIPS